MTRAIGPSEGDGIGRGGRAVDHKARVGHMDERKVQKTMRVL